MEHVGRDIRTLRQKEQWSQGEVAKRLDISIPAFSKIETGITDINLSRLDQISRLFNVSIMEILCKPGEKLGTID
jgi:transcriptional regulator with XRE-family HTH domain